MKKRREFAPPPLLVTREVEVVIPKNKRSENLERMSEVVARLEQKQAEKAGAMADLNGELKEIRSELRTLNGAIQTGKHTIEMDCHENLVGKMIHVSRVDTGEVVEKRPATHAELQTELFEEDGEPEHKTAASIQKIKDETARATAGTNGAAPKKRGRKPKAEARA